MMDTTRTVRPSPIAGTWYSANPQALQQTVDAYLEAATLADLPGEVMGLVAPHAGYQYSGAVAGHAFKAVLGRSFDRVAVISPLHAYHSQPILTSAHRAYHTPLGDLPIAQEAVEEIHQELQSQVGIGISPIANDQEHSLEIELPFLQRAIAGSFELIPIMLRDQTREVTKALGQALAKVLEGSSFLLVASSDLSHFYPETTAHQLDRQVMQMLGEYSPEGLFDLKDQGVGQACGLAAMAAVLWATRGLGGDQVTLLKYDTSATATGDRSSVVGYGAAAITRPQ